MFVSRKVVFGKPLSKLSRVCLSLEKLVNGKYFLVKENFAWFSGKCFPKKFGRKTLSGSFENLEMSYYLLIISNLVVKLLIAIYILFWIFIFQFHLLKFNFYINFNSYFYNCYLFFPYYFFIEIFYLSNLILILFIVTYFIWNNLWNINYYYFNSFIFYFFLFFRFDLYYFDYYLFYLR